MNALDQMMVIVFRPSFGSRKVLQHVRCFAIGQEGGDLTDIRESHAAREAIRTDYPRANIVGHRWLNPEEITQVKAGNAPIFEL